MLPLELGTRLVQLAHRYGITVLADGVYQLLHYGPAPPPPMAMLDDADEGTVLSLGSFSKILTPGLRIGWVQGSANVIRRFTEAGMSVSGGGLIHFAATMVNGNLELGLLQENVASLRVIYGERVGAVRGALLAHLGDKIRFSTPSGGYFLWLHLDPRVDADALLPMAQKAGVSYRPGTGFSASGGFHNALRISTSLYETGELTEAIRRLGAAIEAHG